MGLREVATPGCRNKGREDRRGVPDMRAVSSRIVEGTHKRDYSFRITGCLVYSRRCIRVWDRMRGRGGRGKGAEGPRNETARHGGVTTNSRVSLSLASPDPSTFTRGSYALGRMFALCRARQTLSLPSEIGEQTKTFSSPPLPLYLPPYSR